MISEESFGTWLKRARRDLDLTQEALAEQAGCSIEMIRKVEGGTARPSRQLAELLAAALQVPPGERAAYVQWARTGQRPVPGEGRSAGLPGSLQQPAAQQEPILANPYKGLRPFHETDAPDFFGREALTQRLVARLAEPARFARFLVVVGPSGSGKSSVVRAGLVPALRGGALPQFGRWPVVSIVPGAYPFEEVEAALLRLAPNPPASLLPQLREDARGLARATKRALADPEDGLVIVLDQLEEIFTLVSDEEVRRHFLDSLYAAAADPGTPLVVVATLRADFYDRPLAYRQAGELLRDRAEVVLPMAAEELERAIALPAAGRGVALEPDLLAAIVRDTGEQPGALPLLQYALTELFALRAGRLMTLRAYRESGGVHGALSRRAESLYAELTPGEQEEAHQLFLRLVTLGEGVEDTRRRVRRAEIAGAARDEAALERVLEIFGAHRLLTFDRDPVQGAPTVEVAHEALLGSWPRLRGWIEAGRESLRVHRRLLAATNEWSGAGHDPSFLAPGARLAQFEALAGDGTVALNAEERTYIAASVAEREKQAAANQVRQARELTLQRRAASRLRYLVAGLALFLLVATGLGLFAFEQRGQAQQNEARALANGAEADKQRLQAQEDLKQSEALRLAAEANSLVQTHSDPQLVALLTLRSLGAQYTPQGDADLEAASTLNYPLRQFTGHTGGVGAVAFSPDGKLVLTGGGRPDTTARLWDAATGQSTGTLTGHTAEVRAVTFSPDGRRIATASADGTVRVWDAATRKTLLTLQAHPGFVNAVNYSPDGKLLASAGNDGTAALWDATTGAELGRFLGHADAVGNLAFSPDGKQLLTASADKTARLWDVASAKEVRRFVGHTEFVLCVAFSPDGRFVATGSEDKSARLWDATTGAELRRFAGHTDFVGDVHFSSDGKLLLTSSGDTTARLWDVQSGQEVLRFVGHMGKVNRAVFSPDGQSVLTSSDDMTAMLWSVHPQPALPQFLGHTGPVWSIAISPDGKQVLTGSGRPDSTARLWSAQTGQETLRLQGHTGNVNLVAFSPDGKLVLTGAGLPDNTARLWDAATGRPLRTFGAPGNQGSAIYGGAFAPDGATFLTGHADGVARLWDVRSGTLIKTFSAQGNAINSVAFSPDGKLVLLASGQDGATLWDVASGQALRHFKADVATGMAAAFSPDGKSALTTGGDGPLILWNVASGQEVRRMEGLDTGASSLAFSPDGKLLLAAGDDNTARLWDVATGRQIRHFVGHSDGVQSVAFSPDGRVAFTASWDGTARTWYVDYTQTMAYLCGRLLRDLTPAERTRYGLPGTDATCPATHK